MTDPLRAESVSGSDPEAGGSRGKGAGTLSYSPAESALVSPCWRRILSMMSVMFGGLLQVLDDAPCENAEIPGV